jgi:diadenosine tetraphosphate (Ap4A) HIT family hydrolase
MAMNRTWPADWEARKRGESCHFCGDISAHSFHSGRTSEALLERRGIAKGHTAVVFRSRHVASFTALTADELVDYWKDIQDVGQMIERVFTPCHMNYLLLGNIVPHLHVHVVPRYLDDPSPERPLPWEPREVPADEFSSQHQQLREAGVRLRRADSDEVF